MMSGRCGRGSWLHGVVSAPCCGDMIRCLIFLVRLQMRRGRQERTCSTNHFVSVGVTRGSNVRGLARLTWISVVRCLFGPG